MFAENGVEKASIIDKTLKKYGDMSASELVGITHKNNTPWSKTYDGKAYEEIQDNTILKYHGQRDGSLVQNTFLWTREPSPCLPLSIKY